METLDILEAAQFLKVGQSTLLKLAESGEVPGGKIGRNWVFIKDDLTGWMRDQFAEQQRERIANLSEGEKGIVLSVVSKLRQDKKIAGRKRNPLPKLSSQSATA